METMMDIQRDRLADKIGRERHAAQLSVPGLLCDAADFIAKQDELIKQLNADIERMMIANVDWRSTCDRISKEHEGVKTRAEIEAEIEKVDHDIAVGREGRSCGELLERKRGMQSVLVDKPTGGEGCN